jgi:hypothetical protein
VQSTREKKLVDNTYKLYINPFLAPGQALLIGQLQGFSAEFKRSYRLASLSSQGTTAIYAISVEITL